jgi:hypothetical protein
MHFLSAVAAVLFKTTSSMLLYYWRSVLYLFMLTANQIKTKNSML